MDLNISFESTQAIQTARLLGFKAIAINKTILATSDFRSLKSTTTPHCPDLKVYNRLTIAVNQPSQLPLLSKIDISMFDMLAIRPMNDSVLRSLLSSFPSSFHILSLDLTQPLLTTSMRPSLSKLIDSGVQIEVDFASCLKDSSGRVQCINQCRQVLSTFSSGAFLSSGARNILEMRSPGDLANFSTKILGLRSKNSKLRLGWVGWT